jgi:iron(III) transport system permease protein
VAKSITWPAIRPAALGSGLLVALYTLSDFGAVSLMRFDTFTRAIYNAYRASFDRNSAAALALILIALTLVLIYLENRTRTAHASAAIDQFRVLKTKLGPWNRIAQLGLSIWFVLGVAIPIASIFYFNINKDYQFIVCFFFNNSLL